jgi:hypothetical protein
MADSRAFEPMIFLVSEPPSGVPIARELNGGLVVPTAGKHS